jgi:PAS domain S-box-containing protein
MLTDPERRGSRTGRAGVPVTATAEQFRLLVEAVRDYAIFLLDPDGRVVSWNAGAERIKGYTTAEIVGRHFACFYEPEDAAAGFPAAALARATREGRYQGRGWRVGKDGRRFYAHVIITALFDEHGQLSGFAKITRDVTAERQAEQTLRERERQLAEAQAIARLGSFEWEAGTGRMTWSPELYRICGLDPESSTGSFEEFLDHVHPADRVVTAETLRRAGVGGTPFRVQARILRPDGELRVVSSWGEVVGGEPGRTPRVLGVCQDVTDLHRREEQLAEAYAQAELSRRLQSGLLPSLSLQDPGLALRTRYQPGQERALLGADLFDALELPDGTVALLIGDVAGHGPDEAAVGVALRAAWRALVLTRHGPGDLLDGLDKVLVYNRPSVEMFTTVCCAWISPDRSRLTVALAGHPPPLLVQAGKVDVVQVQGGPALGIYDDGYPWEAGELEVGEAWTLLCYTDGLVEGRQAPGSVERFGIEALAEAVIGLLDVQNGLDELLDGLLGVVHAANGGDLSDDVAVLCVSRLRHQTRPAPTGTADGAGQLRRADPLARAETPAGSAG